MKSVKGENAQLVAKVNDLSAEIVALQKQLKVAHERYQPELTAEITKLRAENSKLRMDARKNSMFAEQVAGSAFAPPADSLTLITRELIRTRDMSGARVDDQYVNGELAMAAEAMIKGVRWDSFTRKEIVPPSCWPAKWDRKWFRNYGGPVWNLVVAATYLANEIDRLIRAGHSIERIPAKAQDKVETTRLPQRLLGTEKHVLAIGDSDL